jgi:hypothetical protein
LNQDIRALGVKSWRNVAMHRRRLAEASEEGQGPHRAVEPVMMMMTMCSSRHDLAFPNSRWMGKVYPVFRYVVLTTFQPPVNHLRVWNIYFVLSLFVHFKLSRKQGILKSRCCPCLKD